LTFENVTKKFENVKAVDALSFQIPENKIIGLIGANGAGKTTSLRMVIRYLLPDSGNIYYRDKDIYTLPDTAFPITYIPDTPVFFEELTVKEHLSFISTMYQTENKVSALISLLELEKHLDKVPSILSKGTQQKLMIICALLRNYEMLVADEPFTGLDPKQIKVLKDIFVEQRANGKTIILSTHLLDMIENICDFYVMIDSGKLLRQGMLNEILNNDKCSTLEELYLYLAKTDKDDFSKEEIEE
jgi:ABC-2 type transport system ATP-binding protein